MRASRLAGAALLLLVVPAWPTRAAEGRRPVIALSGERWRLDLFGDRGTVDFLVQPQGETGFVSVLRPNGEPPWYGYNEPTGERRTCEVKPASFGRQGKNGPVAVRCVLDAEREVVHEALYYPLPDGVLVISRYSARTVPADASLVRVAPKLDVNVDLLTHYAFSGPDGKRHSGPVSGLGERDSYAGVGGWGPRGDQAAELNPETPYVLLFSPQRAVSAGVVFPLYGTTWRGVHSFLQLWTGASNFWYTGFLSNQALRSEHAYLLYAWQSGSPDAVEADTKRLCAQATEMISKGEVDAPELRAMLAARERFERDWPALMQTALGQPPTNAAWLAILMLRSARESVDRDPVAASQLIEQADRTLKQAQ